MSGKGKWKSGQSVDKAGSSSGGTSASTMYQLKPPYTLPQTIELPHGMYRVTPLSVAEPCSPASGSNCSSVPSKSQVSTASNISSVVPEEKFRTIEQRQLEILDKLTNLREMIVDLQTKYVPETEEDASTTTTNTATLDSNGVQEFVDIVVNANPTSPPYSLLFCLKLLREYYGYGVRLRAHTHSSIKQPLSENLNIFTRSEEWAITARTLIQITLIWKDTDDVGVMVNPFTQSEFQGEGNMARFLSRLIPPVFPLNYDALDWTTLSLIDGFITQALDEKKFNLDMVEAYLKGKNKSGGPFLLGGISIADFVTFSSVARHLLNDSNSNLSKHPHLKTWIESCQNYGEFELFAQHRSSSRTHR